MKKSMQRRQFMSAAAAGTGALTMVPRSVLGGVAHVGPSDKLTLAHIGLGVQSITELGGLLDDPAVQIVAICDPNKDSNDYVEWGKHSIRNRIRSYLGKPGWGENRNGCPGGRDVGCEIVNTYYANKRKIAGYKGCASYVDFRELLDKAKDVDAVKVMTPDHLHATVAVAAMKRGKHVLMHKPVANRLYEGRLVVKTARETGKATHLLAYGNGVENGRIAQRIKQGVIGKLREVHNWSNRPVWPQYPEIPKDRPPVPKGFDWDLWLGPAEYRPYHPHYTHTVFRGWYDFGGGSMADMGIYSLWPVFEVLELGVPVSAEAWATHTCTINDNVSRVVWNDYSYPAGCSLRFHFNAKGDRPAVDLFWYDGGMKPRLPRDLEALNVTMKREGILYVGDKGAIMADFLGQNPRLFARGVQGKPLSLEGTTWGQNDGGYGFKLWVRACLGGKASPGSFQNAAAITDAVNLGTVALRARRKVVFDSEKMNITNAPAANRYLTRKYRKGWALAT